MAVPDVSFTLTTTITMTESTSISDLILKVLPNKPEEKRKEWIQKLSGEEYDTVGDLLRAR